MSAVTEPMDPIARFRENVSEKIRGQMGDMMPEELVKKIVEDAIKQTLYQPTRDDSRGYSNQFQPWIVDAIKKQMTTDATEIARKHLAEHQDELKAELGKAIAEQWPLLLANVLITVMQSQDFATQNTIMTFMNSLRGMRS